MLAEIFITKIVVEEFLYRLVARAIVVKRFPKVKQKVNSLFKTYFAFTNILLSLLPRENRVFLMLAFFGSNQQIGYSLNLFDYFNFVYITLLFPLLVFISLDSRSVPVFFNTQMHIQLKINSTLGMPFKTLYKIIFPSESIRNSKILSTFNRNLKTFLFKKSYSLP